MQLISDCWALFSAEKTVCCRKYNMQALFKTVQPLDEKLPFDSLLRKMYKITALSWKTRDCSREGTKDEVELMEVCLCGFATAALRLDFSPVSAQGRSELVPDGPPALFTCCCYSRSRSSKPSSSFISLFPRYSGQFPLSARHTLQTTFLYSVIFPPISYHHT